MSKEKIKELEKRIEELERRPQYIPVIQPCIVPNTPPPLNGACPICGRYGQHTCVTC